MSTSAVTSVFANYAQAVTGGRSTGGSTSTSSALQEASETPAQTAKEAQAGDPVAKVKLRKAQLAKQQQADNAPATEPGKGMAVDHKA